MQIKTLFVKALYLDIDTDKYSIATIILPPIFNPPYLALNLTENNIQYHFLILLAISFPTISDFTFESMKNRWGLSNLKI